MMKITWKGFSTWFTSGGGGITNADKEALEEVKPIALGVGQKPTPDDFTTEPFIRNTDDGHIFVLKEGEVIDITGNGDLYHSDGTLLSHRKVNMNGKKLSFEGTNYPTIAVKSTDNTGGGFHFVGKNNKGGWFYANALGQIFLWSDAENKDILAYGNGYFHFRQNKFRLGSSSTNGHVLTTDATGMVTPQPLPNQTATQENLVTLNVTTDNGKRLALIDDFDSGAGTQKTFKLNNNNHIVTDENGLLTDDGFAITAQRDMTIFVSAGVTVNGGSNVLQLRVNGVNVSSSKAYDKQTKIIGYPMLRYVGRVNAGDKITLGTDSVSGSFSGLTLSLVELATKVSVILPSEAKKYKKVVLTCPSDGHLDYHINEGVLNPMKDENGDMYVTTSTGNLAKINQINNTDFSLVDYPDIKAGEKLIVDIEE